MVNEVDIYHVKMWIWNLLDTNPLAGDLASENLVNLFSIDISSDNCCSDNCFLHDFEFVS